MASEFILYSAEASYYGAKIHAYLNSKRIPFTQRLATRNVFRDEIVPRVGWAVIPVMVTPTGDTLQDTSDMIDYLEDRYPHPCVIPTDPLAMFVSYYLELLADEWLKMPALHYRWNYNRDFAITEFGRNNDPDYPPAKQREIGAKVAARFQDWLPKLGITSTTIPVIEAEYAALLAELDTHFRRHSFLLSEHPTLGDFAFFGPMYAHMLRDPESGKLMHKLAPAVVGWIERLRGNAPRNTTAAAGGALPKTLTPILARLSRDYIPILKNQTRALQTWLSDHPADEELPRYFGEHTFALGRGTDKLVSETRALFSYDQWMLQRVLDVYARADARGQRAIAEFLPVIGASDLLDIEIRRRLERRNFRLFPA